MPRVPDLAEGDTITEVWCDAVTAASTIAPLRVATTAALPTSTLAGREPGAYCYIEDVKRLVYWDGVGWTIATEPVQAYAPAQVGLTIGAGALVGEFQRGFGWCEWSALFTLGAGSAVAATASLAAPIAAASLAALESCSVVFFDTSAAKRFAGGAHPTSTTVILPKALSLGVYVEYFTIGAAIPFAWATGDTLNVSGRYRMTTRYS